MPEMMQGHQDLKVLFCFSASDGSYFVELKRPSFKGSFDFSNYCSWFQVKDGKAEKLDFMSWDKVKNIRLFNQGTLKDDSWTNNLLKETKIYPEDIETMDNAIIESCLKSWETPLPPQ